MSFLYGAAGGLYDAAFSSISFDMHMAAMFCFSLAFGRVGSCLSYLNPKPYLDPQK